MRVASILCTLLAGTLSSGGLPTRCDCDPPPATPDNIRAAAEQAAIVFTGEVERIIEPSAAETERCVDEAVAFNRWVQCHQPRVHFRVVRAWKGVEGETVTLGNGASNCDYPFEFGRVYLVYAFAASPDDLPGASWCGLSRPREQAEADLKILGPATSKSDRDA